MWSQILLCCLVGLAYASNNPAWKDNTEYTYQIRGRSLASLHEVANHYSGILAKARLTLQSRSDGNLFGKLSDVQYAQVHADLPGGWEAQIPDSEISYKTMYVSDKSFQIVVKNGVIRDVIVSKDIRNWEANIIKSIVSQFQLDTSAQNVIDSHINTFPKDQNNNKVFKTLEETVTGEAETLYNIHPLPEYILQSEPWLAPQDLRENGQVIEILKSKNYTHSKQRPTFYFGLSGMDQFEPSANKMGAFFTRSSNSRVIVTGNLNRYTIQNSYTFNEIVMSPTLRDQKKGSVVSMVNVTLSQVRPQSQTPHDISNPISVGLLYRYNYEMSNAARPKFNGRNEYYGSDESNENSNERLSSPTARRFRRNPGQELRGQLEINNDSFVKYWQEQQQETKPSLHNAPYFPFMPLSSGYQGQSVKKHGGIDILKKAEAIAREIEQELQDSDQIVEKYTLTKFTILTDIVRIMDRNEMTKVAEKLYSQEQDGLKRVSWTVYRDAVAQAGTGPALLTIEDWIQNGIIKNQEAADVVATMANNALHPTEEYFRKFYELVKSSVVEKQHHLNETALLSFAKLLNEVYVDEEVTHNEYPAHVYGLFSTEQGKQFMRDTVIPYFAEKLNQAINRADTHQIHTYIRVLGNIGDRQVLPVFKPYLEGKKPVSQFQRFMMTVALDKLVESKPVLARSVLWKIYQNSGERQETRAAAVYLLMRTVPPTDMLQHMAKYTHVDSQETVNAAVKTSIENAANLHGEEHIYLRESARAAKPLLNERTYGLREAYNHLRSYVVDELKLSYDQTLQSIVGDGSYFPKALTYSLHASLAGLKRQLINAQAMVSSIGELTNVLRRQTQEYKNATLQSQATKEHTWSSQYVAELLDLKVEEKEQLEGFVNIKMGNLQSMLSFDNHTIEQLPKVINKIEQILQEGRTFQHVKFMDNNEFVIAFPTEMGLPFVYTHKSPIVAKVSGHVQAAARPAISRGQLLHKPNTVLANVDINAIVHGKTQGHLSFVTPFENQQYIAGYDKTFLVNSLFRAKVKVDVKNMQVEAEFEPRHQNNERVLHYSTVPFTSQIDILKMEPIASRATTHIIKNKLQQGIDTTFGKKETGFAFHVQSEYDQQKISLTWFAELIQKYDPITAVLRFWNNGVIEYHNSNIRYDPQQSNSKKVLVKLGYQQQYRTDAKEESNESSGNDLSHISQTPNDSAARQQDFIDKVSAGISNVNSKVLDTSFQFVGDKSIEYTITGAVGKSNVDPKSRVLFLFKKHSDGQQSKPYEIVVSAKSQIPNTNGLDLTDSFNREPEANTQVKISFGENYQSSAKVSAQVEARRSEARKQYLMEEPLYHACQRERQEGNYQLSACANMTIRSNLLDRVNIKIQHEDLKTHLTEALESAYNFVLYNYRLKFSPYLEIKNLKGGMEKNQVNFQADFAPNLESVNVSLKATDKELSLNNILVTEWPETLFVVHPVFHLPARVQGKALGINNYRRTCVVDQTQGKTYLNRKYPITIGNKWTVMMQYVPTIAREQQQSHKSAYQQLTQQYENYIVLVKENPGYKQKEVIISFNNPKGADFIEIKMKPSSQSSSGHSGSNPSGKVYVGEQEVKFTDKKGYDINGDLVQIYALPNGEVKVEIRDNFYVIYDGSRVKVTLNNGKFRGTIRGICGQANDEPATDFLTSDSCIVSDSSDFISSYAVERKSHQREKCYKKEVSYATVISDRDARSHNKSPEVCTVFKTRYVVQNDEICFTIRPMPVCVCQQRGTIRKNVGVHCVKLGEAVILWKNQVDNGGSPDFSLKKETKKVEMDLPQECYQ